MLPPPVKNNMFAIAKQRRTNKIWINMHNLSYLSLNMNQNLILKRSTDRIQFAAIEEIYFRQFEFYTLNVFPSRHKISWFTSLSFICASEGLYKKDDSCKKKGVSIKHKCVLLMFIKGSLQTLYVVYMWLTENWNQFLVSFTGK